MTQVERRIIGRAIGAAVTAFAGVLLAAECGSAQVASTVTRAHEAATRGTSIVPVEVHFGGRMLARGIRVTPPDTIYVSLADLADAVGDDRAFRLRGDSLDTTLAAVRCDTCRLRVQRAGVLTVSLWFSAPTNALAERRRAYVPLAHLARALGSRVQADARRGIYRMEPVRCATCLLAPGPGAASASGPSPFSH